MLFFNTYFYIFFSQNFIKTKKIRAAAGVGNMEMLRFLFDEGCPWDRRTCAAAARNSDLEALRWLREKGCPWDSRTLDAAAEVGAMDLFEWATSNNCPS